MAPWTNIGSGNGLLSDCTKQLPEPIWPSVRPRIIHRKGSAREIPRDYYLMFCDLSFSYYLWSDKNMMTSSNGNIFRVTGPLCGEFTGPGEFPAQRPVTRSFDVFFDLHPNKRLSKQWWGWWFETQSCRSWRHRDETKKSLHVWAWPGCHLLWNISHWPCNATWNICLHSAVI